MMLACYSRFYSIHLSSSRTIFMSFCCISRFDVCETMKWVHWSWISIIGLFLMLSSIYIIIFIMNIIMIASDIKYACNLCIT